MQSLSTAPHHTSVDLDRATDSGVRQRPLIKTWSRAIVSDMSTAACALSAVMTGAVGAVLAARGLDLTETMVTSQLTTLLPAAGLTTLLLALLVRRTRNAGTPETPGTMALAAAVGFATVIVLAGRASISDVDVMALAIWALAAAAGAGACAAACRQVLSLPVLQSRLRSNVAIFGASADAARLVETLRASPAHSLAGLFEDRAAAAGRTVSFGVTVDGNADDMIELVRQGLIDEIVIALPSSAVRRIAGIARKLLPFPVDVRLCAPIDGACPVAARGELAGTFLLPVNDAPIRDWGQVLKALEDRIIGTIALLFALPLFGLIGLAIKIDSQGPVFFRQKRHGVGGQSIVVWKFRTMHVMENGAVVRQATKDDPRITRVGRILRKTSLDELPQLINVFFGEMSLVGPRPHAIAHNEYYGSVIDKYDGRNQVRPGITGWAQINGFRGETQDAEQMARRVDHDIWYISNWSLFLDLKILLLTPIYGLVHKNAY